LSRKRGDVLRDEVDNQLTQVGPRARSGSIRSIIELGQPVADRAFAEAVLSRSLGDRGTRQDRGQNLGSQLGGMFDASGHWHARMGRMPTGSGSLEPGHTVGRQWTFLPY
jgi:hypothetical protein